MIFQDMTPYSYKLPFEIPRTFCVGWIGPGVNYSTGDVPQRYVEKLSKLVCHRTKEFDLHVNVIRGIHDCNFCLNEITNPCKCGRSHPLGMSEIWLPWEDKWLAAPSMVVHYMSEHRYMPPSEFLEAVESCSLESKVLPAKYLDEVLTEIAARS